VKTIPLTQGLFTLVDDEDYPLVNQWKWFARRDRNTYYAIRTARRGPAEQLVQETIYLHRLIVGANDGQQVDHANRNGLDNRRTNLRVATLQQNNHNASKRKDNTSGFKGVSHAGDPRSFRAMIGFNGKQEWLGRYATAEEAAHVYDARARELFGEFAATNFPITE
jgi:hypothetical protein